MAMNQSKLESLLESLVNILIGFGVALASQLIIFPMVGIQVELSTNLEISAWFTLVSIIRSYLIRRFFNAGIHKTIGTIARRFASSTY